MASPQLEVSGWNRKHLYWTPGSRGAAVGTESFTVETSPSFHLLFLLVVGVRTVAAVEAAAAVPATRILVIDLARQIQTIQG